MTFNKKKILKNITFRAITVFLGKLLSFVIVPILARYLGPESFGEYSYIIVIAGYTTLGVNFGFLAFGTRSIAYDPINASKNVNTILSTRIIVGVFTFIVLSILSLITPIISNYYYAFLLIIIGEAFFVDFYFYGKKNVLIPSLAHLFAQSLFILLAIFIAYSDLGLTKLIYSFAISKLFEASFLMVFYLREHYLVLRFNLKTHVKILKMIFPLGFGNKLSFLKNSIPVLLIPIVLNYEALGYYSGFMKFVGIISAGLQILFLPLGPFIAEKRNDENIKRYIKYFIGALFFTGIFFSFMAFLTMNVIIEFLLGNEFIGIIEIFPFGSFTIIFIQPLYLGTILLVNYLGADKAFLKISFLSFLIAIIFIPILLQFWGIVGAFLGSFISSFIFISLLVYKLISDKNAHLPKHIN